MYTGDKNCTAKKLGGCLSLDREKKLFAEMTNLIDEFGTEMIRIWHSFIVLIKVALFMGEEETIGAEWNVLQCPMFSVALHYIYLQVFLSLYQDRRLYNLLNITLELGSAVSASVTVTLWEGESHVWCLISFASLGLPAPRPSLHVVTNQFSAEMDATFTYLRFI